MLTQAIEDGSNNTSVWRPIGDGTTVTLEILTNRRNSHRQAIAKVYATLCALHVAWYQTIPPRISPWIIALAIHGVHNLPPLHKIFTHDLLQSYNPQIAQELAHWPLNPSPDTNVAVGSPCGNLIAAHLDIMVHAAICLMIISLYFDSPVPFRMLVLMYGPTTHRCYTAKHFLEPHTIWRRATIYVHL